MRGASSVAGLGAIPDKYASKAKIVTLVGMNDTSAQRSARLSPSFAGAH